MRNEGISKIKQIMALASHLPYFCLDNLAGISKDKTYLKILLSRYEKAGRIIRLKKGMYVTKDYINEAQKKGSFSFYMEFAAGIIYQPSYLSLEYILYRHNLLTEVPRNITSVTLNKTSRFSNAFGHFFYHTVKNKLFCGFSIENEQGFRISRATKAKALFDYLYLRKNVLFHKEAIKELRLNLDFFKRSDVRELKKYIELEGSGRMKEIIKNFFI